MRSGNRCSRISENIHDVHADTICTIFHKHISNAGLKGHEIFQGYIKSIIRTSMEAALITAALAFSFYSDPFRNHDAGAVPR